MFVPNQPEQVVILLIGVPIEAKIGLLTENFRLSCFRNRVSHFQFSEVNVVTWISIIGYFISQQSETIVKQTQLFYYLTILNENKNKFFKK